MAKPDIRDGEERYLSEPVEDFPTHYSRLRQRPVTLAYIVHGDFVWGTSRLGELGSLGSKDQRRNERYKSEASKHCSL